MSKPPKHSPADDLDPDLLADEEEALAQELCQLALDTARGKDAALSKQKSIELNRLVRKCLQQRQDSVLYDAVETARDYKPEAWALLKERVEEAASVQVIRKENAAPLEISAFAIPLLVRSAGGLKEQQGFQDPAAFDALTASIGDAGLESPDARVVLIAHAYHPDEMDGITYSELHEMTREAARSMTEKKLSAAPAMERSMSGWPESGFAADDMAVELRFLLGFALYPLDDPFYKVPVKEAQADVWYDARAARFRAWTEQAAPLVRASLVNDGRELEVDFLYQDLFFGAREAGMAAFATLEMLSDLGNAIGEEGLAPSSVTARISLVDDTDMPLLRIELYADQDSRLFASAGLPIDPGQDARQQMEDTAAALETLELGAIRF